MQDFSLEQLTERMLHRRAVQAVIWGMPAVNFELLRQATSSIGAADNQVVFWSRLPDWKNQTLTPNPDTLYFFPFYNTRDAGPMVLEIPPAEDGSITGSVDDGWEVALEDVGPAGVDQGRGGKYLIVPPGNTEPLPDDYIPLRSPTFAGFAALRSNIDSTSDADIAKAVTYGKRVGFYPLARAANPPSTDFVDAVDAVVDSTIPYDLRFYELLDRFVQREPWLQRDRAMIEVLTTIGIRQGAPFDPDAQIQTVLADAAAEAHAWLDAHYADLFSPPYFSNSHWALPASAEVLKGMQTDFADSQSYPVDGRGLVYSFAYFSAKHLGAGQFYLMAIVDKDGHPFDAARVYHLRVPANPPVRLYWSATAYDRATHALIRGLARSSRTSKDPGLKHNPDGTTDVFFGPQPPDGQESNWIPTNADGRFEVLFRLYGPTQALFDKTWQLPDIEPA